MKANECRVGNLVTYENKTHNIFGISEEHPFLDTIEYGAFVVEWIDLKPIKLTKEWFLKFGFLWTNEVFGDDEIYFIFQSEDTWDGSWTENGFYYLGSEMLPFGKTIEFVHQLQNLYFALTGKELEFRNDECKTLKISEL